MSIDVIVFEYNFFCFWLHSYVRWIYVHWSTNLSEGVSWLEAVDAGGGIINGVSLPSSGEYRLVQDTVTSEKHPSFFAEYGDRLEAAESGRVVVLVSVLFMCFIPELLVVGFVVRRLEREARLKRQLLLCNWFIRLPFVLFVTLDTHFQLLYVEKVLWYDVIIHWFSIIRINKVESWVLHLLQFLKLKLKLKFTELWYMLDASVLICTNLMQIIIIDYSDWGILVMCNSFYVKFVVLCCATFRQRELWLCKF